MMQQKALGRTEVFHGRLRMDSQGHKAHTDRAVRSGAHPHAAALALSTHHAQCQLPNVIVIVTRNCSMIIS